jgi:Flp pilus assembly protein TadG
MKRTKAFNHRTSSPRRGAAAVEFAMVLPVFVIVIVGSIELSNLNTARSIVINESREAARLAINHNANEASIRDRARTRVADILNLSTSDVSISFSATSPEGNSRSYSSSQKGDLIQVNISVPYSKLAIFTGALSNMMNVSETCTMQRE